MELVTLAHVTLNRVGSAGMPAWASHQRVHRVVEVGDDSPQTLRELVMTLAVQNGESREALEPMWQESRMNCSHEPGVVVFNIQGQNVQYGEPYAFCSVHPALKIDGRYFKLEEVAT